MKGFIRKLFHKVNMKFHNKIMIKYILSYLLILLIPLLGILMLNNKYFIAYYQNEVMNQKQDSIKRLSDDLDVQTNLFFAIAGQLSIQEAMQSRIIYGDVNFFTAIKRSLMGFAATHQFFSSISFYSTLSPDTVYTNSGTFNKAYYYHYKTNKGNCSVDEKLASVKMGTWTLPNLIYSPNNDLPEELEYSIPIPGATDAYIMFYIPESSFYAIAPSKDMQTFIYDKYYQQVYPFNTINNTDLDEIRKNEKSSLINPVEISGGRYLLSSRSEKNGLLCARIISKDIMLAGVIRIQRVFTFVMMFLIILGGIFVYLMAFINYRPIKKLSKFASDKVNDIPINLYGTDRAYFALEKLDKQLEEFSKNNQRDKLLYRLIHGKKLNRDVFESDCARAGLCFSSKFMRVVLIFCETEYTSKENLDVLSNINQILSGHYELSGMEYLENNCYLIIIGYDTERDEILKNQLNAVASNFSQYIEGSVKISVGGPCTDPFELSQSYFQAVLTSKLSSFIGEILFYDDTNISDVRFIYPKIELDTLYNAIVNANTDKIKLLTDILVDMIHANNYNNFITLSLCYDIINTYLRAMDELNTPGASKECSYGKYKDLCNLSDIKSYIDIINDLRNQAIKLVNANSLALQPDDLTAKAMEYVKLHYKDIELCVSNVAEQFKISISNLSHQFKSQTGLNISDYISDKKLLFAKELLRDSDITVNDVAIRLGYNQTSSFIRKFKQCENITPNEYRITFCIKERCDENRIVK